MKTSFESSDANQRDVNVAAALEAVRHADALNAAGRVGLEPLERVNLVALDRDQTAARVGRGDADRDFLAAIVLRALELHLQLRVLVERPFHDSGADDGETDLAHLALAIVRAIR